MKNRLILKGVIARITAVALLGAASAAVMLYALGVFEIPLLRRNTGPVYPPEISSIEESIKNVETGQPLIPVTSSGQSSQQAATGDEQTETLPESVDASGAGSDGTQGESGTGEIPGTLYLLDLIDAGYVITDGTWSSKMKLAEIVLPDENLSVHDNGNKKTETKFASAESGILFTTTSRVTSVRSAVELYMGYIIVDAGKRDSTSVFPSYVPSEEDPQTLVRVPERPVVKNKQAVAVYSSYGILIGVYPATDVAPAYTRDSSDRPLFLISNKYYYIDELTGDFLESDYIDAVDGRGLYFDYPARYGAPDAKLRKWSLNVPITHRVFIDEYYVYARFAVNWRLARQILDADARYADIIAKSSRPFAYALKIAKAEAAEESRAAKTATTIPPETAAPPEITGDATETGQIPGSETLPEGVTVETPTEPVTEVPTEPATDAGTETGSVPEITTDATPAETSAQLLAAAASAAAIADAPGDPGGDTSDATGTQEPAPETSDAETSDVQTSEITTETPPETSAEPVTEPETEQTSDATSDATGDPTGTGETSDTTAEISTEEETTAEPTEAVSTEKPHDLLDLNITYDSWRFIFAQTQPAENPEKTFSITRSQSTYYNETITWASGYRYAKAFNFSGNYAVVVDDFGHLGVINRNGTYTALKNELDTSTRSTEGYTTRKYYTEPVIPDISAIGSYYFDNGLLRVREIWVPDYYEGFYVKDRDVLIDYRGREYALPSGYTISAYSEGVIILEANGLYGCYSTLLERWIADPVFTYAGPFIEGLCVLGLSDGTRGVIDRDGIVVIPFSDGYTEITQASSGVIACYSADAGWRLFAKVTK